MKGNGEDQPAAPGSFLIGNAGGGRWPFPLRESEGRALPHPPPGIPTGFCHEARGCAAEALPRVKVKDINNPNGVVPMVRMDGM